MKDITQSSDQMVNGQIGKGILGHSVKFSYILLQLLQFIFYSSKQGFPVKKFLDFHNNENIPIPLIYWESPVYSATVKTLQ